MDNLKCKIVINKKGDEYVGLDIKDKEIIVFLPIGYNIGNDNEMIELTELSQEQKKDIKEIMLLLSKKNKVMESENSVQVDIDILSAIKVVNDYSNYGLYKQTELKRKNNYKGRINWQRTIHQNQTYIKDKIIYTNIVNEYIDYESEKEIQKIQENCLYEISKNIGFLIGFTYPKHINMFSKYEMLQILHEELKNTNEDIKSEMLMNLLNFVQNTNFSAIKNGNISIKFKEFQYIYEDLIDYYGIKDKSRYYPKAKYYYWENDEEVKLKEYISMPDTIIMENSELLEFADTVFILDAKYKGNLPNEYDIFKQIRYKKYLEKILKQEKKNYENIKNVFVLPKKLENKGKSVEIEKFYATSIDYKSKEKIYLVYVDMKSLIINTKETMKNVLEELKMFHI